MSTQTDTGPWMSNILYDFHPVDGGGGCDITVQSNLCARLYRTVIIYREMCARNREREKPAFKSSVYRHNTCSYIVSTDDENRASRVGSGGPKTRYKHTRANVLLHNSILCASASSLSLCSPVVSHCVFTWAARPASHKWNDAHVDVRRQKHILLKQFIPSNIHRHTITDSSGFGSQCRIAFVVMPIAETDTTRNEKRPAEMEHARQKP